MQTNNFLMSGKVGDFVHGLYAVKQLCLKRNVKADIYMYGGGWELGIEKTCEDFKPVLLEQDYINSVNVLDGYTLDEPQTTSYSVPIVVHNQKRLNEGYTDIGSWIRSDQIYKKCFTELYSEHFNFSIPNEYAWLKVEKQQDELKNKILVHRRNNPVRINSTLNYNEIIRYFGKRNMIFISYDESDYHSFEFKDQMYFLKVNSIKEWFTYINSCEVVISNLSAPAAIAHALNKPRVIELPYTVDSYHCMGEENYSETVFWYLNEKTHMFGNLQKYLETRAFN